MAADHTEKSRTERFGALLQRFPPTKNRKNMPRVIGAYLNYCRTERYFARTQRTIIELAWRVPPLETIGLLVAVFDHAR